jgi:hypothetical protein
MRIADYGKALGLTLAEIRSHFGSPSTYRDSRTAVLVIGDSLKGLSVRGTMVIHDQDGDLVIQSVRAMDSGAGSMMMRKICDFADRHKVTILDLHPGPYPLSKYSVGVRKLRKKELVAFYKRFGFTFSNDKTTMSRPPKETA